MAKPTSQERRKQVLKQRQAELQREESRREAAFLLRRARDAHRWGDAPSVGRLLKKALALDPDHADALRLLAEIHELAGHHADALGYLRRLRALTDDPAVLYNIGTVYRQMAQPQKALEALRGLHRLLCRPSCRHLASR